MVAERHCAAVDWLQTGFDKRTAALDKWTA